MSAGNFSQVDIMLTENDRNHGFNAKGHRM